MTSRTFSLLLIGAVGGLLAFLCTEPFVPKQLHDRFAWDQFGRLFGMMAGVWIGGLIGLVSGIYQGSRRHAITGLVAGGVLGLICGPIGLAIGGTIYESIQGKTSAIPVLGGIMDAVARALGWAAIGASLGAAEGAVGRSVKRTMQGLVGGLLGGFLGGVGFTVASNVFAPVQTLSTGQTEVGMPGRAVGLVLLGAGIGLMIGIAESAGRRAWLRLVLGRNEGREWAIDVPQLILGRDERAHVPLFGDQNVAPYHATIENRSGQFWLFDQNSPIGTGLNNQRVQQAPLQHGDRIQIGPHQLEFFMKGPQARRIPAAAPVHVEFNQPQIPVGAAGQTTVMAPVQASNPTTVMTPAALTLVATTGPLTGQRFPVQGPIEIGRELPTLPMSFDSGVSRRHASLIPQAGTLQIADLGSTNGTLLNGNRIQSALAKVGDTVQIGMTIFRIES